MRWLLLVSLIWAFSFGLIKSALSDLDPFAAAAARLLLCALIFVPWLRDGPSSPGDRLRLAAVGSLQFGLMYVLYIAAYRWLPAYGVALLTVLTPLYVVLLDDLMTRRVHRRHLLGALLAVAGAGWLVFEALPARAAWPGVLLLQGANLCFAAGQLLYRRLRPRWPGSGDAALLAWMYLGAVALALFFAAPGIGSSVGAFDRGALLALLYLGIVPSGIAFWLWNRGAARSGAGELAVANNLKIPLGVIVAAAVFGEAVPWGELAGGAVLIGGGFLVVRGAGGRRPAPRDEEPV